jgi:hypoxanthine-DNA glycosylase
MASVHNIPPLFDERSEVLILGSFPSVKSREGRFFYHHPQNRFWKVMAAILTAPLPETVEEKRLMLISNRIALWDVIESCEIRGSDDNSIRDAVPNDLRIITGAAPIRRVFTNGGTAHRLYGRFCESMTGLKALRLPSTSPANASYSLEALISRWSVVADALK